MEQMELSLQQAKQEIREEMAKTAQSFIVIGYRLRQILDSGAYIQDGYNDFNEFAKKEFGLSQSGTSRFISINKNYSENGYGAMLKEEYRGYSCSQLTEMLSLSENDRTMVSEKMPVSQIREVKDFIREEDKMDGQTNLFTSVVDSRELYLSMFKGKADELRHLLEDDVDEKEVCEVLNPSGSRVFRHKTVMIIMGEQVTVRVFGGNQEKFAYMDILRDIRNHLTIADVQEVANEEPISKVNQQKDSVESKKAVKVEKKKPQAVSGEHRASKDAPKSVENVDSTKCESDSEPEDVKEPEVEPAVAEEPEDAAVETNDAAEETNDAEESSDAAVEKVEGEVVLDPNVIRGYKAAMSAQIRQLGTYLENENWEAMEAVAKDIVWRCGKIMNQ
ncbi:MAG: hypothetical protein ACLUP2_04505 [Lachnospiraceae bacterium]